MKKKLKSLTAKRYRQARARNEARRRKRFIDRKKDIRRSLEGIPEDTHDRHVYHEDTQVRTIVLPVHFNLIKDPETVISILRDIELKGKKYGYIILDMRDVIEFDLPAITALNAVGFRTHRIYGKDQLYGIRWPRDPVSNSLIKRSGFKNYTQGHTPNVSGGEANMMAERKRNILPTYAQDLANIVDDYLHPGRRGDGDVQDHVVYTTVYELMKNTSLHASSTDREESWWVAYSHDSISGEVEIVFIDCGIGIMESLNRKVMAGKIRRMISGTNARFLESVFNGEIPSSTGIPGRGTGLPTFRETCVDEKLITGAVVVTNDVVANIAKDEYSMLENIFSGTLVYFRVPA